MAQPSGGLQADTLVLGAGIAGVSTALALARAGVRVILADNGRPEAAASWGNAGLLQAEAVEPYAMPRAPGVLLRMLLGRDNAFDHDLRGLLGGVGPLLSYFRHSAPARHRATAQIYAALVAEALPAHAEFAAQAGVSGLLRTVGYLAVTRRPGDFAAMAAAAARTTARYGVPAQPLTGADLARLEPALAGLTGGAVHWTTPVAIDDPGTLLAAYADAFAALGGLRVVADARGLTAEGAGWAIATGAGRASARRVVLALGAASPGIARRFGHRFPLIAKRGYHRHFTASKALSRPVLDADNGLVLAPMRGGVRLTTGACLRARPEPVPRQIARGQALAGALLGCTLTPASDIWTGVRPCMPDMLPVLGESARQPGLWFHFGHGHQGLTLGPATAIRLARQMTDVCAGDGIDRALAPARFG